METFSTFKGGIAMLLAVTVATAILINVGAVDVSLGTGPAGEEDFRAQVVQTEVRATLKKALPLYADALVTDPSLDEAQRESLRLLYLPVVNEYVKTGDNELVPKANILEELIVHGPLRATKTEE